jgi:RNA polymerase sigma factor (sigma-70 family)
VLRSRQTPTAISPGVLSPLASHPILRHTLRRQPAGKAPPERLCRAGRDLTPRVPPQPSPSQAEGPSTPPEQLSLALEALVVRFAALVRRVAWRHGLYGDDMDEVMQDVRLRLWRARGESEQIKASSAYYVYRTAMSAALDMIRRRRRTVGWRDSSIDRSLEAEEAADALPSSQLSGGDPEAQLEASETTRAVEAAVERISKSRRAVVRMYLMGHPPMEIAGLMGWTEPKTRNLLYRGLADLREELTAMGYGPGGVVV